MSFNWNKKNTIIAVSAGVYAALALFFYVIVNNKAISSWINSVLAVLAPLIIGALIAYFCSPIMNMFERRIFKYIPSKYLRRVLSISCTYLLVFLGITVILLIIIPQLVDSYNGFIDNIDLFTNRAADYLNGIIKKIDFLLPDDQTELTPEGMLSTIKDWFLTFSDKITDYIGYVLPIVSGVMNTLLGLFFSIYILSSKERLAAQCKKISAALFTPKQYDTLTGWTSFTNKTFGRYIKAQLLDALLVTVECGIIFSIFRIPFPMLLAFIVGVTNIIPVFGPFIGGIPAGFIVLITDPSKLIWFLLLLLIIQQIDGNIVLPMLVGSTTGMTSFGVLCAIIIMGGYFGITGMVLGVPVFAVTGELIRTISNSMLKKKGLSVSLADYYTPEAVIIGDDDGTRRKKLIPCVMCGISGFFRKLFRIKKKPTKDDTQTGNTPPADHGENTGDRNSGGDTGDKKDEE